MPDKHPSDLDQDAHPSSDGVIEQRGRDRAPTLADDQAIDDAVEDDVDERSKLSFPTSDPPATWAGTDRPGSRRAATSMTDSSQHDQDAEPPTPDCQEPDQEQLQPGSPPASHPDPAPGADVTGTDDDDADDNRE